MQAEYATDIVFKRQSSLQAIYPHLLETLIQAVKPADIATFLGASFTAITSMRCEIVSTNVRWERV